MHEPPQIPNYKGGGWNPRLQVGMALALEPMVNEGTWKIKLLDDEWTAVTADGKLSAHFEHSIAITDNGPLILSQTLFLGSVWRGCSRKLVPLAAQFVIRVTYFGKLWWDRHLACHFLTDRQDACPTKTTVE